MWLCCLCGCGAQEAKPIKTMEGNLKTYQEMSAELGKPEKSIDNALQRIKKKLQKLSEDDEEDV